MRAVEMDDGARRRPRPVHGEVEERLLRRRVAGQQGAVFGDLGNPLGFQVPMQLLVGVISMPPGRISSGRRTLMLPLDPWA